MHFGRDLLEHKGKKMEVQPLEFYDYGSFFTV